MIDDDRSLPSMIISEPSTSPLSLSSSIWWSQSWSYWLIGTLILLMAIYSGMLAMEHEAVERNTRTVVREQALYHQQKVVIKCMVASSSLACALMRCVCVSCIAVLIGSARVGKTTFMSRFNGESFATRHSHGGMDFARRVVPIHDVNMVNREWQSRPLVKQGLEHMMIEQALKQIDVPIMVWDTPTNRFAAWHVPRVYYR